MLREITGVFFLALGAACLFYLIFLLAKRVDFAVVWLPMGALFLASGLYLLRPDRFRLPYAAELFIGICFVAGIIFFLFVEGLILGAMRQNPPQNLDVVIVLGAQVRGNAPSRALLKRLQKATAYLLENNNTVAVLSGGQGDGEAISEAQCMYDYLTAQGIAENRLILESASTSTEENLRFSAGKIAVRQQERTGKAGNGMTARTGILSNNFHIFRALKIARKTGYTNVCGISARSDFFMQPHNLVREFFALLAGALRGTI